ncbi:maleylpyruvate isomerase N-terminal domain-containing protein [Mycobacterium deserti]|uniref:Maleylpyruvate isomerase N-terminal domain-containing protein n=1 Tax=Mycobacterium deserti TaxID=2978347 RepID=A0ABT2MES6_9MYCO|nr:maleylpyruvate isomerase N-terminal domain-containing protein [Mycobacterium deserti]MCT7659625.1 maleylpyruvate isomerase N-terminal domain-containing protein [Mycobacterium deserti]
MRPGSDGLRQLLADAWERWARRCAELTPDQWSTPTRCRPWDVAALLAHVCPTAAMFDELDAARIDEDALVTDAAELLRRFNAPGGVAHTGADDLADQAVADAAGLTPEAAASRFSECAQILRSAPIADDVVLRYPVVGSTTMKVIAEVALMEATVHLLDLADAVGGIEPSPEALAAVRDLLIAVPDPTAAVEVLAGRAAPAAAVPAIR